MLRIGQKQWDFKPTDHPSSSSHRLAAIALATHKKEDAMFRLALSRHGPSPPPARPSPELHCTREPRRHVLKAWSKHARSTPRAWTVAEKGCAFAPSRSKRQPSRPSVACTVDITLGLECKCGEIEIVTPQVEHPLGTITNATLEERRAARAEGQGVFL